MIEQSYDLNKECNMNGKIFLPLNHLCLRTVGFEYHLVDVSLAHENDEDVDALDHVQEGSEVPEKNI